MNVSIEFNSSLPMSSGTYPTRISAQAGDLSECDAASTCASDTDQQELFDQESECVSFQSGNRVSIRNLDPSISLDDLEHALYSLGMKGASIACPTFSVVSGEENEITQEYNFGYATIALSTTEEAVALNYLIECHGGALDSILQNAREQNENDDDSTDTEDAISIVLGETDDDAEYGPFIRSHPSALDMNACVESVVTYDPRSVRVEFVPSTTIAIDHLETIIFQYMSLYGHVVCCVKEDTNGMRISFSYDIPVRDLLLTKGHRIPHILHHEAHSRYHALHLYVHSVMDT
jgi:hypothetical protein